MPPAYRLLVVDLDGTLLARDGSVSPRNRAALERARSAGMKVIIATGRSLSEARHALDELGHDGLVIAAGGSQLCDAVTGRTIDRRVLPRDVVASAVGVLVDQGHRCLILKDNHATGYDYLLIGDGELDPASAWWFEHLPVQLRYADHAGQDPDPHDTLRAGAVAHSREVEPIADTLRQELGERAFLQHWPAVTQSHATGSPTHLLEIFQVDVNKWTMLAAYCGQEDIDSTQVAAIGDGLNDVELVANAGLGVAMANADPRVRAVARRVTADHDDDGVALAVDRIVSEEW